MIYEYDDYNRLVRSEDAVGITNYTYRADGLVESVDGPWENDNLTYSYDRLGRLTGVTPQLGQIQSYGYDDLDRLTTVQTGTRTFTYGYTGADPRVQTLTRPQTGQTTYTYADPLKRLTAVLNSDSNTQMINRFDYAYADTDHPDQRSSETFTNGPDVTFTADQLTTYDYNTVEQLIYESTNGNMVYDEDGNLIQGYTPAGEPFAATYDAENRMTTITYTGADTIVYRTEFVYRSDNYLAQIRQYENSTIVDDTRIVRDGLLASQDRDAANQIVREYTWGVDMGGGIGGLLNMLNNATNNAYLYDGKGNVSAVVDTAQTVAAAYRYDSFGRLLSKAGALDQPFQFSTKRHLTGTGLSYYGYRYYTAALGRWMKRDPIEEAGGINLYAYVQNDPVNIIDPYGLRPSPCGNSTELQQQLNVLFMADIQRQMRELHFEIMTDLTMMFMPMMVGMPPTPPARSAAQKRNFLRQLFQSGKLPKWMNQWLKKGKVPPGYNVDHRKPLSIGGADAPSNMRLQNIDMHRMHHRYYRPWR